MRDGDGLTLEWTSQSRKKEKCRNVTKQKKIEEKCKMRVGNGTWLSGNKIDFTKKLRFPVEKMPCVPGIWESLTGWNDGMSKLPQIFFFVLKVVNCDMNLIILRCVIIISNGRYC